MSTEPETRGDVLEERVYRCEDELRALHIALESLPRVDPRSGVITRPSGARVVAEEVGDARRYRDERPAVLTAIRRTRAALTAARAAQQRIGARWPVGLTEIGRELGYPASTVKQWRNRGLLPTPAGEVSGHPFWWRRDVMAWAQQCGRDRLVPTLTGADASRGELAGNMIGAWR